VYIPGYNYVVIDFIESAGLGQHAKTISVFYCIADASCGDQAFAAIKLTGLASADFLCHLSELIISTQKTFLHLADSDSLVEGHITPESFYQGLGIMGVALKQSETDKLFRELDINNKG